VILVVNHSFATYDIMLLGLAVYEATGRFPRALGDRWLFRIDALRQFASFFGAVEADPQNARRLLEGGELLVVAPGGMREALRPSSERYQVRWEKRRGFARLALQTQSPVVLAACPRADDLYTIYPSFFTRAAYRWLKLPIPLLRGRGLTLLPRRVSLAHYLSEPLVPMADADPGNELDVSRFHSLMIRKMNTLMARGLFARDSAEQGEARGAAKRP
jgi:1-acyl-sn-glycerol-3-phosphate acyltransferase